MKVFKVNASNFALGQVSSTISKNGLFVDICGWKTPIHPLFMLIELLWTFDLEAEWSNLSIRGGTCN